MRIGRHRFLPPRIASARSQPLGEACSSSSILKAMKSGSGHEIEIKLVVVDVAAIGRRLAGLRAVGGW